MGASAVAGLSMGRCYLALASEMAEFLAPRQPGEDTGLEDIRSMAEPVLRHRILVNYRAEAEGITVNKVIARLIEEIKE
jgi:MoxR-like ATPase